MATLNFKGKAFVQNLHLGVQYHQLLPVPKKSLSNKPSLNDNLIIHGDNLKALKTLLPIYAGKVHCIYIDPPYNTGNEKWAYNDNVTSPMMKEWLGKIVDREDMTRHDKWLCMMMPRLKLLKELLREDGVILASIDDNEVHHFRVLMDEVFGEENFVAQLIWEKGRKNDSKYFSVGHEYILVYAAAKARLQELGVVWREEKPGAREIQQEYLRLKKKHGKNLGAIQENLRIFYKELPKGHPAKKHARYGNVDERGVWRDDNISWPGGGGPGFDVIHPKTKKPCAVPEGGWRYSTPEKMQEMIKNGVIVFRHDHTEPPIRKTYLVRDDGADEIEDTENEADDIGIQVAGSYFYRSALQASNTLMQIFKKKPFENPKDHGVISRLIHYVTRGDKSSIILDSFAGSGTTAHAVLDMNKGDGGSRKFLLVECSDYADFLTAERVRRVISGVKGAKDELLKKGLGGSFTFCELGPPFDVAHLLEGKDLPSYESLAQYVFHTATGATFDAEAIRPKEHYIGRSASHDVYLWYAPDVQKLKDMAFTLTDAEALGKPKNGKRRLVFAPLKYVDQEDLDALNIDFVHLPYEIYERIP